MPILFKIILGSLIFISTTTNVYAEKELMASWYSVLSLHRDGQWKITNGKMSNGKVFKDEEKTCATRLFKLGCYLRVTNTRNRKSVIVKVTDRIGKRFAHSRIDLSSSAFKEIAELKEGVIPVKVEVIHV